MLMRYVPEKTNLRFMHLRWPAFVLSMVLIFASIVMVSTRGLNLGIDFAGGSVIEVSQPEGVEVEDVRSVVGALPRVTSLQVNSAIGTGVDAQSVIVIRFKAQAVDADEEVERAAQQANNDVRNALAEAFGAVSAADAGGLDERQTMVIRSSAAVGPKVSGELFRAGITALVTALVLMSIYILWRFDGWQFSLGAVAALAHDVVLTIGVFALLQLEFNLTTIAALLTIIGYSMNDTVVVFDRIREEMRKYKKMPLNELIDLALNLTLSRTLLTSGTTLLALLAIFFLGGPVLRGMSFALIWGVVIGTYSSVFVASSLLLTTGVTREKKPVDDVPGFQGAP